MMRMSISSGIALLALLLHAAVAWAVPLTLTEGLFRAHDATPGGFGDFGGPRWSYQFSGSAPGFSSVTIARNGRFEDIPPSFSCGGPPAVCAPGRSLTLSGLTGGAVRVDAVEVTGATFSVMQSAVGPASRFTFTGPSFTLPEGLPFTFTGPFEFTGAVGDVFLPPVAPGGEFRPTTFDLAGHGEATVTYGVSPNALIPGHVLQSAELTITAIPEPSTLALISTGLFAGAVALRRRFLRRPGS